MRELPALMLLHGFTNTGRSWRPVVAALQKPYRPIAPDIRGQGDASETEPVTLSAVLGDLEALAPERFTLVGYSMGGRIAQHLALALPERVERLILIGASPGLKDPREREARRLADEELAREFEGLTIAQVAERWAQTPVLAGVAPEVAQAAHEDRLRSTPAGLARSLLGLGTGVLPPLWNRLGELHMPVSLITGARDVKFTEIAKQMLVRLPHAELTIVPGAGHAVHAESPERVAVVIDGRNPRPDV